MKRLTIPVVLAVTALAAQACTPQPPAPDVADTGATGDGSAVCEYREPVDGSLPCYRENVSSEQFCVLMTDGVGPDGGYLNPRCAIVG